MANTVTVSTQTAPRDLLAEFSMNPRLIRLLESITRDITINIPDFLNPTAALTDEAGDLAQTAFSLAVAARAIAQHALSLGQQADEGPPSTSFGVAVDDPSPPPAPVVLPDMPDDVFSQLAALRDRLAVAERAIEQLKEGPTP